MATYSHNLAGAAKKSTKTTCSETLATRTSPPTETGIEPDREGRSFHIFGVVVRGKTKEREHQRERAARIKHRLLAERDECTVGGTGKFM